MTDEQIVEAMAGVEGWVWLRKSGSAYRSVWRNPAGAIVAGDLLPDYPNDHNACQRVIDELSDDEADSYIESVFGATFDYDRDRSNLAKATPRQKCEAILKAKGLWQKD